MTDTTQDIYMRAFSFALRIVRLCQYLERQTGVSRTLSKQVLRSGTSIGANLEEGRSGQSRADFISKVSIALKEARETHYWLRLLHESKLISENKIKELIQENDELIAILTTILKNTKRDK